MIDVQQWAMMFLNEKIFIVTSKMCIWQECLQNLYKKGKTVWSTSDTGLKSVTVGCEECVRYRHDCIAQMPDRLEKTKPLMGSE